MGPSRAVNQTKGLPERVIYALSDATMGYKVRNSTYRGIAEIADAVASRDFKLLVDHGLLFQMERNADERTWPVPF
ncbi:MAG: hypothetical protein ACJ74Y_14760 [Bryobacteraceae bacterium]